MPTLPPHVSVATGLGSAPGASGGPVSTPNSTAALSPTSLNVFPDKRYDVCATRC
ncbi:hypothetical protein PF008_g1844 [Phytophthora fragariae]|uniref:Uncharacterized protein n=1 Tax=Phytophthora fragariae TaxID=53985 RepID=A0A6G0SJ54_9STRA|nr:hypothetical protein PF008_g1844 [Phytophthora fragariae]